MSNCPGSGCVAKIALHFNHPVKELVWYADDSTSRAKWAVSDNANAQDWTKDLKSTGLLRLNGHERFTARDHTYFRDVQRYQHHTGALAVPDRVLDNKKVPNSLYVYSFALQPEEHQPSGTCNFSRIDNAVLEITTQAATDSVDIYAVNYNVLRVMSGMGGLAYSN